MTPPRPPLSLALTGFGFSLLSIALTINWRIALPWPWWIPAVALGIGCAIFSAYLGLVALAWWWTRR